MATKKSTKDWPYGLPGGDTHFHPLETGFYARISPKGLVTWGFHFRDATGAIQTGKYGNAPGMSVATALALHEANFSRHHSSLNPAESVAPNALPAKPVVPSHALITLRQGFDNFLIAAKRGGGERSPRTIVNYKENYARIVHQRADDALSNDKRKSSALQDDTSLASITTSDWKRELTRIRETTVSGARICYVTASAIYRTLIEENVPLKNPLDSRPLRDLFAGKDSRPKRSGHINVVDLRAFFQGMLTVAKRGHGKKLAMFLLLTGWRLNCACQMKWCDLDLKRFTYTVRPGAEGWKGYEGRIAINTYAASYLLERKAEGGIAESEYVFPGVYGSETEYAQNIQGTLNRACAALLYRITPHDLRRTFITVGEVVTNGNLKLVGKLVGHKQSEISDGSNTVTAGYVVRYLQTEIETSRQIAETILEIAGALPLDDATAKMFKVRGLDVRNLELSADLDDAETEATALDAVRAEAAAVLARAMGGSKRT